MNPSDTQVEKACEALRKGINAAENSNHAGEVFVVTAAHGIAMHEALRRIALASNRGEIDGLTAAAVDAITGVDAVLDLVAGCAA